MTHAVARRTDPQASWDAARSVNVPENQRQVLYLFHRCGDMTDERMLEAAITYDVQQSPSGLRTRRKELAVAGLVRDTGRKQKLDSGRWAIVWGVA